MRGFILKAVFRSAALLVLLSFPAGCSREPFSPGGGGFSVKLPGTPTEQSHTIDTPSGPVVIRLYHFQSGNWVYLVGYSDYDKIGRNIEQVLDGVRDGALKGSNSRLVSETAVSLDGHPGRELRMAGEQGISMRLKIVLVGTRLYQVGVVTPKGDAGSSKITAYLDSFRLKEPLE